MEGLEGLGDGRASVVEYLCRVGCSGIYRLARVSPNGWNHLALTFGMM